jgi:hypothetical protein
LRLNFGVSDNNNNDRSAYMFAEMLLANQSLKSLVLFCNIINSSGMQVIVSALQKNTFVCRHRISNQDNFVTDPDIPYPDIESRERYNAFVEAASAIADLLKENKILMSLEIPFPTNVESMCIALHHNNTLRELALRCKC